VDVPGLLAGPDEGPEALFRLIAQTVTVQGGVEYAFDRGPESCGSLRVCE
jgi:hypothetical protein